ncbi:MAG: hypothetical protein ACRC37_02660, partial [Lentisphaeria bacterium]
VDAVCDRLVLIDNGQIKFDGTPEEFRLLHVMENVVVLTTKEPLSEVMESVFMQQDWVSEIVVISANTIQIIPQGNHDIFDNVYTLAKAKNWKVASIKYHKGRLDDVFREITLYDKGAK